MSWYNPWKHAPLSPPRDISALSGSDLSDEKTRSEIEKLRVEILDERSWRTKLFLSLVIPLGGALAFLNTWHNDHSANLEHRIDQTYTDAAKQLSDDDASVRLNGIQTLSSLVKERDWFSRHFSSSDGCNNYPYDLRSRESVALIIGRLTSETDSSVLDAIAQVADAQPCLIIKPLLSVDRSAAVDFARAAGEFAAVYMLHKDKKISLDQGGLGPEKLSQQTIEAVDAVTVRTGSPFEARSQVNQVFVSGPMLSTTVCPFAEIYDKQFELTATALNSPAIDKPPSAADVDKAMRDMEKAAAMLEKVSFVLQKIADGHLPGGAPNITVLRQFYDEQNQQNDLYGVAIVIGEYADVSTIRGLQAMGAFVQHHQPGDNDSPNTCPPHPRSAH